MYTYNISIYITVKTLLTNMGSLVAQMVKSAYNAGDLSLIPGSRRAPGEENGNPIQYSCLRNPLDRGAWWATVQKVTKSWYD